MRYSFLALALAAALGTSTFDATAADDVELSELKAQLAALQAKVAELDARTEAQSEVNVTQATAIEATQETQKSVDKLSKLVNDTKVGGRLFLDLTNIRQEDNGARTNASGTGFDVSRFYLTFDHKFDDVWSANLTTDAQYFSAPGANQPASVEMFIKKAYVQGKFSDALFVRAGAADTPWIPYVEKFYGMRYVQNTVTDRLSYGTSADWGLHVGGDSAGGLSYAASLTNGRGYRNPSRSKGTDFEARLGYAPTQNTVVAVGAYTGKRGNETQTFDPPQTANRVNAMAAYASSKYRLGAEWFQARNWAVTNIDADKADGYSVWGSVGLTDGGITAFARYDNVDPSNRVDPSLQDTYYHFGIEFPVIKGFKLATVYKQTHRENSTATDLQTREFGVWGDVQF